MKYWRLVSTLTSEILMTPAHLRHKSHFSENKSTCPFVFLITINNIISIWFCSLRSAETAQVRVTNGLLLAAYNPFLFLLTSAQPPDTVAHDVLINLKTFVRISDVALDRFICPTGPSPLYLEIAPSLMWQILCRHNINKSFCWVYHRWSRIGKQWCQKKTWAL